MLKLCQLMETFWLDWVMVSAVGPPAMLAEPACTDPPTGKAKPSDTRVRLRAPESAVAHNRRGWRRSFATPAFWAARWVLRVRESFMALRFCEAASLNVGEGAGVRKT